MAELIPQEVVEKRIYLIRRQKVMFQYLYVEIKARKCQNYGRHQKIVCLIHNALYN
jgi:hypothetical protein